jgi:hypothetical protein
MWQINLKGEQKMKDKILVTEIKYADGAYILRLDGNEDLTLGDIKEEATAFGDCLTEDGLIDEARFQDRIKVEITFKNMLKDEVDKLPEFTGF